MRNCGKKPEGEKQEEPGARGLNLETGGQKLPQVIPVHNANTELVTSVQGRRGNSHSKSRSELLNHYQEEAASGFPIDPPRHSQAAKEVGKDRMDHNTKRVSHSGPLAPGVGWTKAGKKYDDMNVISTRADLSTLSGLVASRTSLSDDSRDKLGPSQPKATDQVAKSSESHEVSGSARRTYRKQHTHSITGSHQLEKGRAKEPVLHGHRFNGNKIHFSGPLLVPSNNMEQMLKEHDRRIQEAARRARLEKARLGQS